MSEWCREELGGPTFEKCGAPAEFILWGKLFAPEALGPRCYDHAAKHAGHNALSGRGLEQTAIYALPPDEPLREWLMGLVAVASSERAARRMVERLVEAELERSRRWASEPLGPMTSLTWPG